MFCKHCGKEIAEDSNFCKYCGGKQDSKDHEDYLQSQVSGNNVKMDIDGNIKATISPSLPTFSRFKNFIKSHSVLVIIITMWFIINVIFLTAGNNGDGFWPIDKGLYGTEIDWNLYNYGLPEFITYIILIPFTLFIIYRAILQYKNKPIKFNPSDGLRRY